MNCGILVQKNLGRTSEVYSERSQTSKMERFARINKSKALIISRVLNTPDYCQRSLFWKAAMVYMGQGIQDWTK